MPFVPGYTHDVFVSYARVDDQPLRESEKGWVTTLVNDLRILLSQRLGRGDGFSMWMDPRLSQHTPLTPEILENLKRSATLLAVFPRATLLPNGAEKSSRLFCKTRLRRAMRPAGYLSSSVVARIRRSGHQNSKT